jgi:hypothetical protein
MSNINIDLIALPGSLKSDAAEFLFKNVGKEVSYDDLSMAIYEHPGHAKAKIVMILVGLKKALKVNNLPFQIVRKDGKVTLVSLEPVKAPAPKKGKAKKEVAKIIEAAIEAAPKKKASKAKVTA